jgi:hypothetical protein
MLRFFLKPREMRFTAMDTAAAVAESVLLTVSLSRFIAEKRHLAFSNISARL